MSESPTKNVNEYLDKIEQISVFDNHSMLHDASATLLANDEANADVLLQACKVVGWCLNICRVMCSESDQLPESAKSDSG